MGCRLSLRRRHRHEFKPCGFRPRTLPQRLPLVGELIRRFGSAVLDRAVFDEIVGSKDDCVKRQPRLFALASVTIETPYSHIFIEIRKTLARQRRLVSGSFGDMDLNATPIVVVITARDQQLRRRFVYDHRGPSGPIKSSFEVQVPTYQSKQKEALCDDTLKLIVLWPFDFDGEAEQSS
jgi:hypothetical protein